MINLWFDYYRYIWLKGESRIRHFHKSNFRELYNYDQTIILFCFLAAWCRMEW
jgi:hypothetical protein